MEVASSSQFDEMMNAWSSCGDEMEGIAMEYEFGNYGSDYSQFCYGVLLEQQHRESYLKQESSDAVFSS
ncbi:hypothetical protein L6164_022750 [Bauhinia variegata]|nr:hypothetical protein L6164_022750 [Bauhinia variegata]